jgi:hypothetical protein
MKTHNIGFLLLALCLTVAACDSNPGFDPDHTPEPVPSPVEPDGGPRQEGMRDVVSFANPSVSVGYSTLKRDERGVQFWLRTSEITPRHAVTIWWVVFNNPEACAANPCDEPDLFNPAVEADVLYAAGSIVNANGESAFAGRLQEGRTHGSIADVFGLPAASGLHDAGKAEVHLVVRSHGEYTSSSQLTTYGGGCTTELPVGTMPSAVGECADIQFSMHLAEEGKES